LVPEPIYRIKALKFRKTMKFICLLLGAGVPFVLLGQSNENEWDTDHDAMPNDWELHNQLDINDPKDAWKDPDKDGIWNLFEYLLGADPHDRAQPLIIEYSGDEELEQVIGNAARGVVLRLPEGHYRLNYNYPTFTEPPRVLLQGGWNTDFTSRDHCRYRTVLDGGNEGSIFNFLIASGNSSAVILDGLTLMNGNRGAINYTGYVSKVQLVLANCVLAHNESHRAGSIIQFEDGDHSLITDFILVNTLIFNNTGTGTSIALNANISNFKVLHSVIAYNKNSNNDIAPFTSGYGIRFRPQSDSVIHIQFANSILWGNANSDIIFDQTNEEQVIINSAHNIFGFIETDSIFTFPKNPSDQSFDPLLQQGEDHILYLNDNSPLISAGFDLGLTSEPNPNIGLLSCPNSGITSTNGPSVPSLDLKLFPNPAHNHILIESYILRPGRFQVRLFDQYGKLISGVDFGRQSAGKKSFSLPTKGLSAGLYYIQVQTQWGSEVASFVKK
jgi:hypothetical protein